MKPPLAPPDPSTILIYRTNDVFAPYRTAGGGRYTYLCDALRAMTPNPAPLVQVYGCPIQGCEDH